MLKLVPERYYWLVEIEKNKLLEQTTISKLGSVNGIEKVTK